MNHSERMSRRVLVAGTTVGVAVLALPNVLGAQEASPAPGTRVIETVNGPVEVPLRAERVVSLDSYSTAVLIDAGLVPVGVPEYDLDGFISVYKESLAGVSTTGPITEPDIEQIIPLEPDLILCITAPWGTDNYEVYSAIAPTVLGDYTVPNAWKALAEVFADAAGRQSELDGVKAAYAARISELQETYAAELASTTWAVALGWGAADGDFALYYPDSPIGTVLTDLGVIWIDAAANGTGGNEAVSLERLGELSDADVILTYGIRDEVPEESTQIMMDNPIFQQLPAMQNGQVHVWSIIIPTSYGEALVILDQIETVLRELQS